VDEARGYVSASLPTSPAAGGGDELQLQLRPDGTVVFKSQARVRTPDAPFCLTPGCISGPGNRARMEALRDALGWPVLETDEDREWVQILLH
jgi:hypothetical protein